MTRIRNYFWQAVLLIISPKHFRFPAPKGLLVVNWIYQRIFGVNGDAPVSVHYTTLIQGFKNIKYGKNVERSFALSGGCYFTVADGTTLEIGDNTIWAFNVCIQTVNHDLTQRDVYHKKSVKIGKNCWIGNGVTILAGVELGNNVSIGANAVVTKSFPDNVVIAGCPAKIIKEIKTGHLQ